MRKKTNSFKITATRVVRISFSFVLSLTILGLLTLTHVKAENSEAQIFQNSVPNITVTPTVAEYKPGVKVLISGSGFEPEQKLRIFITMGGVPSGLHFMVKPEPVPNDLGAFASVWSLRREIARKLLEPLPTVYTISVETQEGKTLCTAPLLFCDPEKKEAFPAGHFLK